jgi:hypothetical protein
MKLFQLIPFKYNRKQHWERVYKKNKPDALGWYQDYPEMSLKLFFEDHVTPSGAKQKFTFCRFIKKA